MLRKNTASQNLAFGLVNASTGAALTGATVTARMSIDGAAQASCGGSVTELANGQYNFAPAQADTNGNIIGYLFTATNAIPVHLTVRTTAADLSDSVRLGLTALPNAAAEASGGLITNGSSTGQLTVAGGLVGITTTARDGIVDYVWDEALSGHTTAGTAGKALSDAGSAGDPWSTSVPGAYSAGSAGYILGTNLDATISSRLAPTTSGRTLDVTSTGAAGIDWGNVENPTTTLGLTGTTVGTVTTVTNVPGAVRSNTAQAGAASTITLDSSASSTNDLYNDHIIQITGGTGAGQARRITDYVGSTKVATVEPAWQTNPDNTSTFSINANAKASLLPTAVQAIWDALTSALTTASSVGKLIVDKLALITSTTTIQTESLVSTDQLITIYQGRTKSITLTVSHTAIDLTGFTPKFGLTKITSNSGTSTLEVTGTVNNPGATGQSVSFSLTAVQTAALAQSPTPDHPFRLSVATAYAYRYSIAATNGSTSCPQLSQNYVDVKPGDTTC